MKGTTMTLPPTTSSVGYALPRALQMGALGYKLVPIPAGQKYPKGFGKWQEIATNDADVLTGWFESTTHGIGWAMGLQPNGSFVFAVDVESAGMDALIELLKTHGEHEFFNTACQTTGGGGMHFIFTTDTEVHNSARQFAPKIDIRGEGGQILIGPTIHPNGSPYAWRKLPDDRVPIPAPGWVIERILAEPEVVVQPPRPGLPLSQITGGYRVVHDDMTPADFVRENWSIADLLATSGWTYMESRGDDHYWCRPGKNPRQGHSAIVHGDSPMVVWSTEVPWRGGRHNPDGSLSFTPFEVYANLDHGGDYSAASREVRSIMPRASGPAPSARSADPETPAPEGAAGLNLPPEFWEARAWLTQVRQAAWSEKVSPDAVWAVLLSRVSATIDPSIILPGMGTLDLFVVIEGHSGAGKSLAGKVARMLYPITNTKVLHDMPIGSGEGLVEAFFRWVDEEGNICSPSKKGAEKVLWFTGAHFMTDEGVALTATAGRSGSIIVPILCQAWMGETMGQTLADATRSRIIPAGRVRVAAQLNIQTANGWKLFADEYAATGLSQRMLCAHAIDPTISGDDFTTPEFPGRIDIELPYIVPGQTRTVAFPPEVEAEIDTARRMAHHPEWSGNPLDTHSLLLQRKIAAITAIIEGRMTTTLDDWNLASQAVSSHRAVRSLLQMTKIRADREARVTQDTHFSERHALADEAVHRAQLNRTVQAIEARLVSGEAIMKRSFSKAQREVFEEAMAQLVDRGLVESYETHNGQTGWRGT